MKLTPVQTSLYARLKEVAGTDSPSIEAVGAPEFITGRALERKGLASIHGRTISPTPESIEFQRKLVERRTPLGMAA